MENHRKTDFELLFLQTVGILVVINLHFNAINTTLNSFFTYTGWVMPFFFFLSGNLFARTYRKRSLKDYFLHKSKTLLLSALFVHLCYGIIVSVLKHYQFIEYGKDLSFYTLFVSPFGLNDVFGLDVSLWFIFQLYILEMIANVLYRIPCKKMVLFDLSVTAAAIVISVYCQSISENTEIWQTNALPLVRTGFMFFFFAAGVDYERYGRERLSRMTYPLICALSASGCYLLIMIPTGWMAGYHAMAMDFVHFSEVSHRSVPYLTFLSVSVCLVSLAKFLSPLLQKSRMLSFIGPNIRYVVYHHMFCGALPGLIAMMITVSRKNNQYTAWNFGGVRSHANYVLPVIPGGFGRIIILVMAFFLPIILGKTINQNKNAFVRFCLWCILTFMIAAIFAVFGTIYKSSLQNL